MGDIFTIKIKKKSQPEWLLFTIIMLPFFFEALFFVPSAKKYILDICWLFLMLLMIRFNNNIHMKNSGILILWVGAFLLYSFVCYICNYQNILYFLWGARNNFRFYVFFFAATAFLSKKDIDNYFIILDRVFWVNTAVCFIQFFVFGLKGDYLGGLFGVEEGCNAYLNNFLVIAVVKSIVFYLNKKSKIKNCISVCMAALLIAALSELKFFFAEFIIIAFLAVIFTGSAKEKILLMLISITAVAVSFGIFAQLFPEFVEMMSFKGFLEVALSEKGYTSSGDLNRLTAIPVINKVFFKTWDKRLFGMGLGNCDTSAFAFLNTPFFKKYSWMHYSWMSTAFIYIETGYIGLVFFYGFFMYIALYSYRLNKHVKENNEYCQIAGVIAVCAILIAIYNSSLRTEAGYMIYFMLSLPFVINSLPDNRKDSD